MRPENPSPYINVIIEGNRFTINESENKPDSALETIQKIETILKNNLISNDVEFDKQELRNDLLGKANHIKKRYLEKTSSLPWIRRFFGSVANKEEIIRNAYAALSIDNAFKPLLSEITYKKTVIQFKNQPISNRLSELPNELKVKIFSYLKNWHLNPLRLTSQNMRLACDEILAFRLRKTGHGNDFGLAKSIHMQNFLNKINPLFGGVGPFWQYDKDDPKKNLDIVKNLNLKEKSHLASRFLGHISENAKNYTNPISLFELYYILNFDGVNSTQMNKSLFDIALKLPFEVAQPIILFLLARDSDLDFEDHIRSTTLLKFAKRTTNYLNAELLHKYKSTINKKDSEGKTPLIYAIGSKNLPLIKLLLDANADINTQCNAHKTPLHYAYQSNYIEVIDILLESGADVNIRDNEGKTVLHYSAASNENVFLKFVDKQIDLNLADNEGNTALHIAAKKNSFHQIIYLLLNPKVNPHICNQKGETFLSLIASYPNTRLFIQNHLTLLRSSNSSRTV